MSATKGTPASTVLRREEGAGSTIPEVAPAGMFSRRPGESAAVMVELADARLAEAEAARRSWTAELEGERLVAAELALLDAGSWWVLHDVPIGSRGANLNHLVIGVGGVFCITTNNVGPADVWVASRAIKVDGANASDDLPKAVREAGQAGQQLFAAGAPVAVVPVLAFIAGTVTIAESPTDVAVLHYSQLRTWLEAIPVTCTPEAAHRVAQVADRPETWISPP
jgi:Nuclease-related domain